MAFTQNMKNKTIEYHNKLVRLDQNIASGIVDDRFKGSPYEREAIAKAKAERQSVADAGVQEINQMVRAFHDELIERYTPHGADMTDDAKIFSAGIDLTDVEIMEYVRRYQGNLTMLRIIADYAKKHNPGISEDQEIKFFISKEAKDAAADTLANYCRQALNDEIYFNTVIMSPDGFQKICGEALADE